MHVLVAYASRHGATQGIAERIAERLRAAGLDAEARPAASVKGMAGYDAFVIGSAAYMFHWLREATKLVRRNRSVLAGKPVWLFSSGPVGTEPTDAQGRDQKVAAVPKEMPELQQALDARDHRVFFGAYQRDRKPIGLAERFVSLMPATLEGFPEGDFRDWPEIDAWAASIARDLQQVSAGRGSSSARGGSR
jgi:menaquinone-dependent protoporphyrinogen oxidase